MAGSPATFFDIGDTLAVPRLDQSGVLASLVVFPFVIPVLEAFRRPLSQGGLGHRLGIISNTGTETKASMLALLDDAGLLPLLDPALLLFSSVEGLTKADVEFFRLAVTRAGVAAAKCLYVGEDADERRVAALAGMRVSSHPLHGLHVGKSLGS